MRYYKFCGIIPFMGREALIAGHELKKAFLREAIKKGVYLKRPRYTSPDQWSKQRKVGFRYAFQDITLEELGTQYGGTRENTRSLNHKFLDNIHKNSPPELQAQYPRQSILDGKPVGQLSREKISASKGGRSLKAKALLERGIIDARQIQAELKISFTEMGRIEKILKEWGKDLTPLPIFASYKKLKETAEKETDDDKLQDILDSLSDGQLRGYLNEYVYGRSEDEIFTTFSRIARKNGFHIQARRVAISIKEAGIPIRAVANKNQKAKTGFSYYWVVFVKHKDRILEVLSNDPRAKKTSTPTKN